MSAARRGILSALALLASTLAASTVHGGAFVSSQDLVATTITHPANYTGTGGVINVTVCVNPGSDDVDQLHLAMPAVVAKWNALTPVTPNLFFGNDNDLAVEKFDWASVATHEVGHCLGLAHPNLASESGLIGPDSDHTKSTTGLNMTYNLGAGFDTVIGSQDDIRGDDVNLHWFRKADNNPFTIEPVTIDTSTYSSNLLDLPLGDLFAANASRDVGAALGFADSECVMQQGQLNDEAQRDLGHDDVATLRLAMAGLDETQSTADDYTINLIYGGIGTAGCDIIANVGGEASFAFCSFAFTSIGAGPGGNHDRITGASDGIPASLEFNRGVDWHYVLPELADLCPASPMAGCRVSDGAQIQVKDNSDDTKDSVKVKLGQLDATDFADFLDPLTDTAYSLCVYDASGNPQPLMESGVGAAATCGGEPCWKAKTGQGYQYKSNAGLLEGMRQIKLKAGIDGKAQVQLRAAGELADTPAIPVTMPMTVQVIADDGVTTECWEGTFASASKNVNGQLKAKGP